MNVMHRVINNLLGAFLFLMSVNVALFVHMIVLANGERTVIMKTENIKSEMQKLLSQSLPQEEKALLREGGFKFTKPTRASCILAALYKKAAGGDMSAIKEILNLISDEAAKNGEGEVTIIDDVRG